MSALDYVIGPALAQGHSVALHAPSCSASKPGAEEWSSTGQGRADWTCERITVVEHVPLPALLHRADLFVTRGGRASLLDAVQGATPVVGMGVLADQPDNAAAFARCGLGRALELTATRDEIAEAMTAVLGDSCYAGAMNTARTTLSQLPPLDIARLRDSAPVPVRLRAR